MTSVRIVNVDYYMSYPLRDLDVIYSEFRGCEVRQVPIIQIYGSAQSGNKTCVHIHGVFPYIYIPYDGVEPAGSLSYKIAAELDKALNISLGQASSNAMHIHNIVLVSGIPLYGYHEKPHQFFKIYFYNPGIIKKASTLLENGAVLGKCFQPHESHINYTLQFMIDYNLHGMSFINLSHVKYRPNPDDIKVLEDVPPDLILSNSIQRRTVCKLEIDALVSDIMNVQEIATGKLAVNPGLAALWADERQRRRDKQQDSQISFSLTQERGKNNPTATHKYFEKKLLEKLSREYKSSESSLDLDKSVYPAETPDDNEIVSATDAQSSILDAANFPDSILDESQTVRLNQSDVNLLEMLQELKDAAHVEADSILSLEVNGQEVESASDEEENVLSQPLVNPADITDEDSIWENSFWDSDCKISQLDGTCDSELERSNNLNISRTEFQLSTESVNRISPQEIISQEGRNASILSDTVLERIRTTMLNQNETDYFKRLQELKVIDTNAHNNFSQFTSQEVESAPDKEEESCENDSNKNDTLGLDESFQVDETSYSESESSEYSDSLSSSFPESSFSEDTIKDDYKETAEEDDLNPNIRSAKELDKESRKCRSVLLNSINNLDEISEEFKTVIGQSKVSFLEMLQELQKSGQEIQSTADNEETTLSFPNYTNLNLLKLLRKFNDSAVVNSDSTVLQEEEENSCRGSNSDIPQLDGIYDSESEQSDSWIQNNFNIPWSQSFVSSENFIGETSKPKDNSPSFFRNANEVYIESRKCESIPLSQKLNPGVNPLVTGEPKIWNTSSASKIKILSDVSIINEENANVSWSVKDSRVNIKIEKKSQLNLEPSNPTIFKKITDENNSEETEAIGTKFNDENYFEGLEDFLSQNVILNDVSLGCFTPNSSFSLTVTNTPQQTNKNQADTSTVVLPYCNNLTFDNLVNIFESPPQLPDSKKKRGRKRNSLLSELDSTSKCRRTKTTLRTDSEIGLKYNLRSSEDVKKVAAKKFCKFCWEAHDVSSSHAMLYSKIGQSGRHLKDGTKSPIKNDAAPKRDEICDNSNVSSTSDSNTELGVLSANEHLNDRLMDNDETVSAINDLYVLISPIVDTNGQAVKSVNSSSRRKQRNSRIEPDDKKCDEFKARKNSCSSGNDNLPKVSSCKENESGRVKGNSCSLDSNTTAVEKLSAVLNILQELVDNQNSSGCKKNIVKYNSVIRHQINVLTGSSKDSTEIKQKYIKSPQSKKSLKLEINPCKTASGTNITKKFNQRKSGKVLNITLNEERKTQPLKAIECNNSVKPSDKTRSAKALKKIEKDLNKSSCVNKVKLLTWNLDGQADSTSSDSGSVQEDSPEKRNLRQKKNQRNNPSKLVKPQKSPRNTSDVATKNVPQPQNSSEDSGTNSRVKRRTRSVNKSVSPPKVSSESCDSKTKNFTARGKLGQLESSSSKANLKSIQNVSVASSAEECLTTSSEDESGASKRAARARRRQLANNNELGQNGARSRFDTNSNMSERQISSDSYSSATKNPVKKTRGRPPKDSNKLNLSTTQTILDIKQTVLEPLKNYSNPNKNVLKFYKAPSENYGSSIKARGRPPKDSNKLNRSTTRIALDNKKSVSKPLKICSDRNKSVLEPQKVPSENCGSSIKSPIIKSRGRPSKYSNKLNQSSTQTALDNKKIVSELLRICSDTDKNELEPQKVSSKNCGSLIECPVKKTRSRPPKGSDKLNQSSGQTVLDNQKIVSEPLKICTEDLKDYDSKTKSTRTTRSHSAAKSDKLNQISTQNIFETNKNGLKPLKTSSEDCNSLTSNHTTRSKPLTSIEINRSVESNLDINKNMAEPLKVSSKDDDSRNVINGNASESLKISSENCNFETENYATRSKSKQLIDSLEAERCNILDNKNMSDHLEKSSENCDLKTNNRVSKKYKCRQSTKNDELHQNSTRSTSETSEKNNVLEHLKNSPKNCDPKLNNCNTPKNSHERNKRKQSESSPETKQSNTRPVLDTEILKISTENCKSDLHSSATRNEKSNKLNQDSSQSGSNIIKKISEPLHFSSEDSGHNVRTTKNKCGKFDISDQINENSSRNICASNKNISDPQTTSTEVNISSGNYCGTISRVTRRNGVKTDELNQNSPLNALSDNIPNPLNDCSKDHSFESNSRTAKNKCRQFESNDELNQSITPVLKKRKITPKHLLTSFSSDDETKNVPEKTIRKKLSFKRTQPMRSKQATNTTESGNFGVGNRNENSSLVQSSLPVVLLQRMKNIDGRNQTQRASLGDALKETKALAEKSKLVAEDSKVIAEEPKLAAEIKLEIRKVTAEGEKSKLNPKIFKELKIVLVPFRNSWTAAENSTTKDVLNSELSVSSISKKKRPAKNLKPIMTVQSIRKLSPQNVEEKVEETCKISSENIPPKNELDKTNNKQEQENVLSSTSGINENCKRKVCFNNKEQKINDHCKNGISITTKTSENTKSFEKDEQKVVSESINQNNENCKNDLSPELSDNVDKKNKLSPKKDEETSILKTLNLRNQNYGNCKNDNSSPKTPEGNEGKRKLSPKKDEEKNTWKSLHEMNEQCKNVSQNDNPLFTNNERNSVADRLKMSRNAKTNRKLLSLKDDQDPPCRFSNQTGENRQANSTSLKLLEINRVKRKSFIKSEQKADETYKNGAYSSPDTSENPSLDTTKIKKLSKGNQFSERNEKSLESGIEQNREQDGISLGSSNKMPVAVDIKVENRKDEEFYISPMSSNDEATLSGNKQEVKKKTPSPPRKLRSKNGSPSRKYNPLNVIITSPKKKESVAESDSVDYEPPRKKLRSHNTNSDPILQTDIRKIEKSTSGVKPKLDMGIGELQAIRILEEKSQSESQETLKSDDSFPVSKEGSVSKNSDLVSKESKIFDKTIVEENKACSYKKPEPATEQVFSDYKISSDILQEFEEKWKQDEQNFLDSLMDKKSASSMDQFEIEVGCMEDNSLRSLVLKNTDKPKRKSGKVKDKSIVKHNSFEVSPTNWIVPYTSGVDYDSSQKNSEFSSFAYEVKETLSQQCEKELLDSRYNTKTKNLTVAEKYDLARNFAPQPGTSSMVNEPDFRRPLSSSRLKSSKDQPFNFSYSQFVNISHSQPLNSSQPHSVKSLKYGSSDESTLFDELSFNSSTFIVDYSDKLRHTLIDLSAGCKKTEYSTIWIPKFAPPSLEDIKSCMQECNIPERRFQEPFYSVYSDVTGKVDVGHNVLKIPSKSFIDLEEFHSSTGFCGIENWRKEKFQEMYPTERSYKNLRVALAGHSKFIITPVARSPSREDVIAWIKSKMKSEAEKDAPKKPEKIRIIIPSSPGHGNDSCDESMTLSPCTPEIINLSPRSKTNDSQELPNRPSSVFLTAGQERQENKPRSDNCNEFVTLLPCVAESHPELEIKKKVDSSNELEKNTNLIPISHGNGNDICDGSITLSPSATEGIRQFLRSESKENTSSLVAFSSCTQSKMTEILPTSEQQRIPLKEDRSLSPSNGKNENDRSQGKEVIDSVKNLKKCSTMIPSSSRIGGSSELDASEMNLLEMDTPVLSQDIVCSSQSTPASAASPSLLRMRKRRRRESLQKKVLFSQTCKLSQPDDLNPKKMVEINESHSSRHDSCQLSGATLNNTHGFKMSFENLQNAKALSEHQNLTILVVELHIRTRADLNPDPQYDSIRALFYSISNDVAENSEFPQQETGVIVVDTLPGSPGVKTSPILEGTGVDCRVVYVKSEIELVEELIKLVRKWDPDIFAGFEIEMLSWGYLKERSYVMGINLPNQVSRTNPAVIKSKPVESMEASKEVKVAGRIILDIWRLFRHEIALQSYTFENLMYHILHRRVSAHSFKNLSFWWDYLSNHYRHITVNYYIVRVEGILQLLHQLDLIGRTCELARLFGIQFYEVLSRGSQFRVESMMLRLAKPLNYIPVSPSVQQRAKMRAPEWLPLILEPESRLYVDPVIVLDFQSLYPSIIIAYNYCFSTCIGRVEKLGSNQPFDFGACQLKVPRKYLRKLEGKINFSPCGVGFVKPEVRRGILPRMLQEILETRLMVKSSMKENKDKKLLQRVLHSRQLGLKLIANVTYGYTAANFSGRMPCIEVGDSVVSKGRETLERAIKMIEETPKWGARVVYGDTDSLFVLTAGRSREDAFKIGAEIAEAVTNDNPPPVKLKLEKVYQPCILQTKKRYVGYMYESPEQEEAEYDAKGIETVRRDGCPAVAKMLEKSLRLLFETRDVSLVKKFVCRQFTKLISGRASIQDLTFAREYRGADGYRPGACVPALELARRWAVADKRREPRKGERVPYVVVHGPPGVPLIRLVRSPFELLHNQPVALRPNAEYYITRVIIPPLNRCFTLIGADVNTWYKEMPRKQLHCLPTDIHSEKGKKSTISQYFATISCAVCGDQTRDGLCETCRNHPQTTVVILQQKINQWEQSLDDVSKICESCCGRSEHTECTSLDCPLLYKLNQIKCDLKQVPFVRNLLTQF